MTRLYIFDVAKPETFELVVEQPKRKFVTLKKKEQPRVANVTVVSTYKILY